jgi:DNA-binding Lrp family transcriptional regulator
MDIISLSNHIIRKSLQLSLNEMAVLCDIKQMSQSPKLGFWCIKSKDKIGEWLDLSRATVFRAIDTLEKKGYLEKSEIGLRPSSLIYDLDLVQDEIAIYIKNNDLEIISAKIKEMRDYKSQNETLPVSKCDYDSIKMRQTQSQNDTQVLQLDNNLEKEIKKEEEKEKPTAATVPDFVQANRDAIKPKQKITKETLKIDLIENEYCQRSAGKHGVKAYFENFVNEFIIEKFGLGENEKWKDLSDARSHFVRWIPYFKPKFNLNDQPRNKQHNIIS